VISDVKRKESHSLHEFLEGRSDHGALSNNALSAYPHIGEISPDDAVVFHDRFSVKDDVLRAAKDRLSTHFVASRGLDVVGVTVESVR